MNPPFWVQLTFGAGVAWSSCLTSRLPIVTHCHRYNPAVTRTSCALAIYGASNLCPELTNSIGSPLSTGRTYCHQVPKHLCNAAMANLVRSWNCHCASRGVGRIALRMLKSTDAYACKLSMRTHLCRHHLLGVPPTSRCVRMASLLRMHLVQQWPSRFCCDLFVPFALSGHFRSELRLLYLETLKHTHQGIMRNGKQVKT
ncbi:hypothetical protein PIB30_065932 [Stylosanthes scabra]|uniref:Secreted protein n=1 Tax=Stylosanthes scabra TaxID=79078 RepID=A0ABU6WQ06_9FABA|nr:hypothetical protein [Stylosanthes scabra]